MAVNMKSNTNEYRHLHWWIKRHYGHASKCENPECPGICMKYEWALKHECEYDYKIENFTQLCISCHKKYDMTQERKDKIGNSQRGVKQPEGTGKKISLALSGRQLSEEHKQKLRKPHRPMTKETKEKISKSNKGKKQNHKIITCPVCGKTGRHCDIVKHKSCKKGDIS